MRAAHATDGRAGNNYRYQRALRQEEEEKERWAREKKSNDFYKKIGVLSEKHKDSAKK
jgi:hypothetical protein